MNTRGPDTGDFRQQVERQRSYLLRYAQLQLRDTHLAEDVVQDALVAALAGEASFAGRSNLRTWLTGILKHKIVDAIRRAAREPVAPVEEATDTSELDPLFETDGHWRERPALWAAPDSALENKQFIAVLEQCLARMPEKTARVFLMREHLGQDTAEICKELGITPTHCWVLLYRARMSLRQCLNDRWFGTKGNDTGTTG